METGEVDEDHSVDSSSLNTVLTDNVAPNESDDGVNSSGICGDSDNSDVKLATFNIEENFNSANINIDEDLIGDSAENEQLNPVEPLPSDIGLSVSNENEREDISDEEFDDNALNSTEDAPDSTPLCLAENNSEQNTNGTVSKEHLHVDSFTNQSSVGNDNNSWTADKEDVLDLNVERADYNDQQQEPSAGGDLEAVSDDELMPDGNQASNVSLLDTSIASGLEDLSSSDEGPASPDCDYTANHDVGVSIDGNVTSDLNVDLQKSTEKEESLNATGLASLEAEPISDEDIDHDDDDVKSETGQDVEAGEVQSPKAPTQPVEELLREAEPISADESSDTDGELPSGDEGKDGRSKSGANNGLESIDSDEGDMCGDKMGSEGPGMDSQRLPSGSMKSEMENISDDENLDLDGEDKDKYSVKKTDFDINVSANKLSSDNDVDKRRVSTNFNEHLELDYEENEGDDGETKMDDVRVDNKDNEGDEDGEVKDGADDDKDEGECSDDDCEEGEIKEPGTRKPFIKPTCRFFQRGHCTWGINCRFLHPGVNDKGNYQMIEIPGFPPPGARPPQEQFEEEEQEELPPPPVPDIPRVETAWERGLRIAKEQRKKASERKEKEPDFEEKRLNLSVEEDKELNKENERFIPKIIVKDPYYDQQAFEEDEYYKSTQNPYQAAPYENFEVRYNREGSFSPPYRDKPLGPPPSRYNNGPSRFSPPMDKFGRQREERPNTFRPEPPVNESPSPVKRPDEWNDPWRRSKSPLHSKRKRRSRSRGRRTRRSLSDSSNSSRSGSSSSGSSRSSRSGSSSGSSSRSRSPEPAPPGVDRHDRYSPNRYGEPRSTIVRGRGGYNHYDRGGFRGRGRGGYNHRGGYDRNMDSGYSRGGYRGRGGGGRGGFYDGDRNYRDGGRGGRGGRDDFRRNRRPSPPDRPLPYVRPRPKSASSRSSSSRSRSRSRSRYSDSSRSRSRSRSSSNSSRSSSSSSSSAGSADSEHLYRDLGGPSKTSRGQPPLHRKRLNSHKDRSGPKGVPSSKSGPPHVSSKGRPSSKPTSNSHKHPPSGSANRSDLDRIPHPKDSRPPPPSSRQDSKYASRNAPQPPVKAKDPLKMVGQKSNIKLTLLPKQQQQSSLGSRPNPLREDSPPPQQHKRRASDRDGSPPHKRLNLSMPPQASALRLATEKAAKLQLRQQDKGGKSPPPPSTLGSSMRAKAAVTPQKSASSKSSRVAEPSVGRAAPKVPSASAPQASATTAPKTKKSMSSRREELLKQLKAVEDAIQKKKTKLM